MQQMLKNEIIKLQELKNKTLQEHNNVRGLTNKIHFLSKFINICQDLKNDIIMLSMHDVCLKYKFSKETYRYFKKLAELSYTQEEKELSEKEYLKRISKSQIISFKNNPLRSQKIKLAKKSMTKEAKQKRLDKFKQSYKKSYIENNVFQKLSNSQKKKNQNPEYRKKVSLAIKNVYKQHPEIILQQKIKRNLTKRKNNTFNIGKFSLKYNNQNIKCSFIEMKCYETLITNGLRVIPFGLEKKVLSVYPYNYDFYLPDLKIIIELHGMWTHGPEPYDEYNFKHIKLKELWESKKSKFYNNAVYTWTQLDVKKQKIVEENNIFCIMYYPKLRPENEDFTKLINEVLKFKRDGKFTNNRTNISIINRS